MAPTGRNGARTTVATKISANPKTPIAAFSGFKTACTRPAYVALWIVLLRASAIPVSTRATSLSGATDIGYTELEVYDNSYDDNLAHTSLNDRGVLSVVVAVWQDPVSCVPTSRRW